MPLIELEKINQDCSWGLWKIDENLKDLESVLPWEQAIIPPEFVKLEEKKKEKLACRIVLKNLLEKQNESFCGTSCLTTRKPYLIKSSFHISVSHSHQKAVGIIHKSNPVGIDIELIDTKIRSIASRVFSRSELDFANNNPDILTILWTMKETLYKINGEKGIDFREELFILPFEPSIAQGITEGRIITKNNTFSYLLKYVRHENHVISFNIE